MTGIFNEVGLDYAQSWCIFCPLWNANEVSTGGLNNRDLEDVFFGEWWNVVSICHRWWCGAAIAWRNVLRWDIQAWVVCLTQSVGIQTCSSLYFFQRMKMYIHCFLWNRCIPLSCTNFSAFFLIVSYVVDPGIPLSVMHCLKTVFLRGSLSFFLFHGGHFFCFFIPFYCPQLYW